MTWKMVVCPVCDKKGYDDERHQIGSHYPCFSCTDEYRLLIQLEAQSCADLFLIYALTNVAVG